MDKQEAQQDVIKRQAERMEYHQAEIERLRQSGGL